MPTKCLFGLNTHSPVHPISVSVPANNENEPIQPKQIQVRCCRMSSNDASLSQARSDLARLNREIDHLVRLNDSLSVREDSFENGNDLRTQLARTVAANSMVTSSLSEIRRNVCPPRQGAVGDVLVTSHKPRPPPRKAGNESMARRDSGSGSSSFASTASLPSLPIPPRAVSNSSSGGFSPTDRVRNNAPSASQAPLLRDSTRIAPMGSALAAIRSRAIASASHLTCPMMTHHGNSTGGRPSELPPSPHKTVIGSTARDPPTVAIRVRGKNGVLHSITRKFYPTDVVLTVLHEYLNEFSAQTPFDPHHIQVFIPLMPPIPHAVMSRVTLQEAKMCPASTIILQLTD